MMAETRLDLALALVTEQIGAYILGVLGIRQQARLRIQST